MREAAGVKTPFVVAGRKFFVVSDTQCNMWVCDDKTQTYRRMSTADQMIAMTRGARAAIVEMMVRVAFDSEFSDVLTDEEWQNGIYPTIAHSRPQD